jgi:chromosome segregation ATPase
MTDTATVETDVTDTPDPVDLLRHRLRDVISRVNDEQGRLSSLEEAQSKAQAQGRHARAKLSEANLSLQQANREERSRIAYEFLNDGRLADDPVAAATANLNAAQVEVDQLSKVQSAIAGEIDRVSSALNTLRTLRASIMSELIVNSDEYQRLIDQHRAAWKQLRTVKAALRAVIAGLHGSLPQRYMDEANRGEPLDSDRLVGYAVNRDLIDAWVEALARLETDADTPLPADV